MHLHKIIYLLIITLPNLLIFLYIEEGYIPLAARLLILLSTFLLLYNNRIFYIILIPFVFISPYYLYYIHFFQRLANFIIIDILLDTNINELLEFTGGIYNLFLIKILSIIWFIFCLFLCKKIISQNSVLQIPLSYKTSIAFCYIIIIISSHGKIQQITNIHIPLDKSLKLSNIKHTYPLNTLIMNYDRYKYRNNQKLIKTKKSNFLFHATDNENHKNITIVLVIGESARRDNWQLHGYHKQTNPKLNTRANIIPLNNMLSTSHATIYSVPMMITRKSQDDPTNFNFYEKSIVSAFKEAGFKSYWLSNQGFYDSTAFYADEADQLIFPTKNAIHDTQAYDEILLPKFNQIIQDKYPKKFILVHTFGSHFNYEKRYPKHFSIFKPDSNPYSLKNKSMKDTLINGYNNSIIYSDFILDLFIQALEKQNQAAFLLYSSDHGEALLDGECEKTLHGHMIKNNFEVASFTWHSKTYEETFPDKIKHLINNKNQEINHTAIFPTLLHAADITIPNDNLDRSILKPFNNYPRKVMGIDFDKTQFSGNCAEIKENYEHRI